MSFRRQKLHLLFGILAVFLLSFFLVGNSAPVFSVNQELQFSVERVDEIPGSPQCSWTPCSYQGGGSAGCSWTGFSCAGGGVCSSFGDMSSCNNAQNPQQCFCGSTQSSNTFCNQGGQCAGQDPQCSGQTSSSGCASITSSPQPQNVAFEITPKPSNPPILLTASGSPIGPLNDLGEEYSIPYSQLPNGFFYIQVDVQPHPIFRKFEKRDPGNPLTPGPKDACSNSGFCVHYKSIAPVVSEVKLESPPGTPIQTGATIPAGQQVIVKEVVFQDNHGMNFVAPPPGPIEFLLDKGDGTTPELLQYPYPAGQAPFAFDYPNDGNYVVAFLGLQSFVTGIHADPSNRNFVITVAAPQDTDQDGDPDGTDPCPSDPNGRSLLTGESPLVIAGTNYNVFSGDGDIFCSGQINTSVSNNPFKPGDVCGNDYDKTDRNDGNVPSNDDDDNLPDACDTTPCDDVYEALSSTTGYCECVSGFIRQIINGETFNSPCVEDIQPPTSVPILLSDDPNLLSSGNSPFVIQLEEGEVDREIHFQPDVFNGNDAVTCTWKFMNGDPIPCSGNPCLEVCHVDASPQDEGVKLVVDHENWEYPVYFEREIQVIPAPVTQPNAPIVSQVQVDGEGILSGDLTVRLLVMDPDLTLSDIPVELSFLNLNAATGDATLMKMKEGTNLTCPEGEICELIWQSAFDIPDSLGETRVRVEAKAFKDANLFSVKSSPAVTVNNSETCGDGFKSAAELCDGGSIDGSGFSPHCQTGYCAAGCNACDTAPITTSEFISFDPEVAIFGLDKVVRVEINALSQCNEADSIRLVLRSEGEIKDTITRFFDEGVPCSEIELPWDISDTRLFGPGAYEVALFFGDGPNVTPDSQYLIQSSSIVGVSLNGVRVPDNLPFFNASLPTSSGLALSIEGKVAGILGASQVEADLFSGSSDESLLKAPALLPVSYEGSAGNVGTFTGQLIGGNLNDEEFDLNSVYRLVLKPRMGAGKYAAPFRTKFYFVLPKVESDDNPVRFESTAKDFYLGTDTLNPIVADLEDEYLMRLVLMDSYGNVFEGANVTVQRASDIARDAFDIDRDQITPDFQGSALEISNFVEVDPGTKDVRFEATLKSAAPTVDDRERRSMIRDAQFASMAATPSESAWNDSNNALACTTGTNCDLYSPGGAAIQLPQNGSFIAQDFTVSKDRTEHYRIRIWAKTMGGIQDGQMRVQVSGASTIDVSGIPVPTKQAGRFEEFIIPFTAKSDVDNDLTLTISNVSSQMLLLGRVRVEMVESNFFRGAIGEKLLQLRLDVSTPEFNGEYFVADSEPGSAGGTCDPHADSNCDYGYLSANPDLPGVGMAVRFLPALQTFVQHQKVGTIEFEPADPTDPETFASINIKKDERERFRVVLLNQSKTSVSITPDQLVNLLQYEVESQQAGFSDIIIEEIDGLAQSDFTKSTNKRAINISGVAKAGEPKSFFDVIDQATGEVVSPQPAWSKVVVLSAIPFAPSKVLALSGRFDTQLSYTLDGVDVSHPSGFLPLETVFAGAEVSVGDFEEDLLSIMSSEEAGLVADLTIDALRERMEKNVNSLLRSVPSGFTSANTVEVLDSSDFEQLFEDADGDGVSDFSADVAVSKAGSVAYISGANLVIGDIGTSMTHPTGVRTVVVDGGNLVVLSDISYLDISETSPDSAMMKEANEKSIGFVVRRADQEILDTDLHRVDRVPGGNLYIHPEVTNLDGSFYLEGLMLSMSSDTDVNPDFTTVSSTWDSLKYHDPDDDGSGEIEDPDEDSFKLVGLGDYGGIPVGGIFPPAESGRLMELVNQLYFRGTLVTGQGEDVSYKNSFFGSRSFAPSDDNYALSKVLDIARLREFQFLGMRSGSAETIGAGRMAAGIDASSSKVHQAVILEKDKRLQNKDTIPPGFDVGGLSWEEK